MTMIRTDSPGETGLLAGPGPVGNRPGGSGGPVPVLTVRVIDAATHAAFAQAGSHSFLQTPAWAAVKPGWRAQSLGWFHGDRLAGSALVLYRRVPGTRRSLAYVPEGPCLPWAQVSSAPGAWLDPFVAQLRAQGAFAVRIGPQLVTREWQPETVKRGLAAADATRFADLAPDVQHPAGARLAAALRAGGWTPLAPEHPQSKGGKGGGGFGTSQPQFTVRIPLAERTEAGLLAACNQQWRRNIHRAERAGVVVREGSIGDLGTFHRLYLETAERDGFTPRPAEYFTRMWQSLNGPGQSGPAVMTLYLAELLGPADPEPMGQPLAAALVIQSGGVRVYVYGASSAARRDAQASTALQWRAIRDALAGGCTAYDLRGIADTLDPATPISGLLRFKLNTGGICIQTTGEWEFTLSPLWHRAFRIYVRTRS